MAYSIVNRMFDRIGALHGLHNNIPISFIPFQLMDMTLFLTLNAAVDWHERFQLQLQI